MIPLIISTVITLILIGWFIVDAADGWDASGFILLLLLITGCAGFGLACGLYTETEEDVRVEEFSYAKSKFHVIIETPEKTVTFSDALTYITISDSSKVFYHISYNIYGGVTDRKVIIK